MFHYSNIRSFATAFEYTKLHSKVRPRLHPAIKGRVQLLLHAKNFTEVLFLSLSLQIMDLISYPDLARALL